MSLTRRSKTGVHMTLFGVILLIATSATVATAHVDPTGCSGNFVTTGIRVFRADGTTEIPGGGTVSPCETIQYQMSVAHVAGTCAFQGGAMFITTPDGVQTNVTPAGGIPCLGGTTAPCSPGVESQTSNKVTYTVRAQDIIGGTINATANYGKQPCAANPGTCGTAHTSSTDVPNVVSGSQGNSIGVESCALGTECLNSICNPAKTDGVRTGLCDTSPVAASTTCTDTDGNACTQAGCDGAGNCVQNHMTTVCTPDSNECTDDLPCDTATGLCNHPPKADSTPCTDTDGNACTTAGCNGA